MTFWSTLLFLQVLVKLGIANQFVPVNTNDKAVVEEGKKQIDLLSRETQMPRYGNCWKNALDDLKSGCKTLTDESQSRMALAFTNCFLEKAGLKTRICGKNEEIRDCVADLDLRGYTTFNNFFTHTHSMCCFLQHQVWHEETSNVIIQLHDNSVNVSEQLKYSNSLQQKLIVNQRKSIETQEKLWSKGHELRKVLEMSKENVKDVMRQFKSSTEEQRLLILEVFDRVASLQSILLGEFTGFYSMIFYVVSACVVYLITSTPRTNGARFWLFLVLTVNIIMERAVVVFGVNENINQLIDELPSIIYYRIWLCRKISALIAGLVLAVILYRYRDLNVVNNQLLVEIRQQNLELRSFIQSKMIAADLPLSLTVNNASNNSEVLESNINSTVVDSAVDGASAIENAMTSTPKRRTPRVTSPKVTPGSHSYNLRQRSSIRLNSIVERETPEEFSDYIHSLAQQSKSTSNRVRSMFTNSPLDVYPLYD